MALEFGSAEWARALADHINASSEYKNSGAKWGQGFNGNMLLSFLPDTRLADSRHLMLRLREGRCDGVEFVDSGDHPDAGFGLEAAFSTWKDILDGKALAATAILGGRLKVRGDKMTLLKHAAAQRALLHCVGALDTRYPG